MEPRRPAIVEEIFDPEFRDLDPQWPNGATAGIAAMKEKNKLYFRVIPDWKFTVRKQLVAGDHVVCHWSGTGTDQGEFAGVAPSGKSITVEGISIFTCHNGKLVEQIIYYDHSGCSGIWRATMIPT